MICPLLAPAPSSQDVLENAGRNFAFAWEAERNPFRSTRPWLGATLPALMPGEMREENGFWQCVRPAGQSQEKRTTLTS